VFDKTGTLTHGELSVSETATTPIVSEVSTSWFWSAVAAVERSSEHPIAAALVRYADAQRSESATSLDISHFSAVPGYGVTARVAVSDRSRVVLIGNPAWMAKNNVTISSELRALGDRWTKRAETVVWVAIDGSVATAIALSDRIKADAAPTIAALKRMNVDCWLLTGDNAGTAFAVARRVGIDDDRVLAETRPKDKLATIRRLQQRNRKDENSRAPVVAMVGDGVNDAAALSQADVGIAIGAGSDIATEAADVVLMRDTPGDVPVVLHLSRVVFSRIRLNFVWAMVYNLIGIPFAAGVFFPIIHRTLPPEFAGLAMAFSSVSVVCSSLLLRRYKRPSLESIGDPSPRRPAVRTVVEKAIRSFSGRRSDGGAYAALHNNTTDGVELIVSDPDANGHNIRGLYDDGDENEYIADDYDSSSNVIDF